MGFTLFVVSWYRIAFLSKEFISCSAFVTEQLLNLQRNGAERQHMARNRAGTGQVFDQMFGLSPSRLFCFCYFQISVCFTKIFSESIYFL